MKQLTFTDADTDTDAWTGDVTIPTGRGQRRPLVLDEGWLRGLLADLPVGAVSGARAALEAIRGDGGAWAALSDPARLHVRAALRDLGRSTEAHPLGRRAPYTLAAIGRARATMTMAELAAEASAVEAARVEAERRAGLSDQERDIELYAANERRFKNRPGGSGRR